MTMIKQLNKDWVVDCYLVFIIINNNLIEVDFQYRKNCTLTVCYLDKAFYDDMNFQANIQKRIGVISQNNDSKNILIKILTNQVIPDKKQIIQKKNLKLVISNSRSV